MDRQLLDKYFNDQCSEEELDKVLTWFQSDEGQDFIGQQMDEDSSRQLVTDDPSLHQQIKSEKIFSRIQRSKQQYFRKRKWFVARVASVVLLVTMISSLLYWTDVTSPDMEPPKLAFTTYVTNAGQQNIFTLSDGTVIHLNEESKLTVPVKLQGGRRTVTLDGEAYFEVTSDASHPFVVHANGSAVKVLGTKFNVKANSDAGNVQVAVVEGKVSLKKKDGNDSASAILTRNNFGLLNLNDSKITIEQVHAENYLSWATHRLVYAGQTLAQVSRDLERLYDAEIEFSSEGFKTLNLTADLEKKDLETTVATIANTFNIQYSINDEKVVWRE